MTYEPLHHKYRPQTFADLVGEEATIPESEVINELNRTKICLLQVGG
jgi:DNA polymerase III gamma/tau subunit